MLTLVRVIRGKTVSCFGPGEFDKSSTISNEDVARGDGCRGLLNRGIIKEKVLAITTGTKDGNRTKDGVSFKSDD